MERRPISRLSWDPSELYWKVWVQDQIKYVPFLYSMKIGRKILGARSWKEPIANVIWRRNGLSPQHLKQFWKCLWGINMSREIVCFQWLLVHKAKYQLMCGEKECRQDVPFLYGSNRDCYTLFVELWFCYGHMDTNHKIINSSIS